MKKGRSSELKTPRLGKGGKSGKLQFVSSLRMMARPRSAATGGGFYQRGVRREAVML